MKDVRARILENARVLFNAKGCGRVSMRAVAESCDIAVGNLTYYFPHKEDLVRAIMQDAFLTAKPEPPIGSLSGLNDQFSRMLDTLLRYAFYFLDDAFLGEQAAHNRAIRGRILAGFRRLREEGVFRAEFDGATQEAVLEMLLLTHLSWMRLSLRAGREPDKAAFLRRHWLILSPYLTERGAMECAKMLGEPPFV